MKRTIVFCLSILICVMSIQSIAWAQLTKAQRDEVQKDLERFFLNKRVKARVQFPAWKDGIDLKTDGSWDSKWLRVQLDIHGVGVEVDEMATITAVKLNEKHIEIHLNGGGVGTTGNILATSEAKKQARDAGTSRTTGGSRINLRFPKPITKEDASDFARLAQYLEPIVDVSSLRQDASKQSIPEEFRAAAAKGQVVEGMDKQTVFAMLGDPKNKNVDISGEAPTEKWQYELSNLKTRIVTFKSGRVVKVDEF